MLAAEHCPDLFANVAPSKDELLEIHHSKISLHRAKTGYNYPTIRLPHTFSRLAGLPTRIYQTVHKGALALLVVISPNEKAIEFMVSSKVTENFSACSIMSEYRASTPWTNPLFWSVGHFSGVLYCYRKICALI